MLSRCAAVLAEVAELVKVLAGRAVSGFDEIAIRRGPAGQGNTSCPAPTRPRSAYDLGGPDPGSFYRIPDPPGFAGIAVYDRHTSPVRSALTLIMAWHRVRQGDPGHIKRDRGRVRPPARAAGEARDSG